MRPIRKPSEQNAIKELKLALAADGHDVLEIPEITDRPDAVLVIDGRVVAIECRTFTSERLLRMHGMNMPDRKMFQLFLPLEPHIWVRDAILAKEPKIPEYKLRGQADSVWLVVHSERGIFSSLAGLYREGLEEMFHLAAAKTEHSFERIYVTGEWDLPAVCIFSERNATEQRSNYARKRVARIPVGRFLFSRVESTVGPDGEGEIVGSLYEPNQEQILLQPLDKLFAVDYGPLNGVSTELTAKLPEFGSLYAELKAKC